jgi:hypothetical protein
LSEKLKSEWSVLEGENKKYVYGEVSLLALSDVLHRFCPQGGVFYDLGSGSGRAVFSAAINHPAFTKLVGVELLEGLHIIADRALGTYNQVSAAELLTRSKRTRGALSPVNRCPVCTDCPVARKPVRLFR